MKANKLYLLAYLAFTTLANGATQAVVPLVDLEAGHQLTHMAPLLPATLPNTAGILTSATRDNVVTALSNDNARNVDDLIQTRWCFRKIANYTNVIGNTVSYFGLAATAIAAASDLIFPTAVPYIVWSGATCVALHVLGIGIAKCSAAQEDVREQQLKNVAQALGFSVVPVKPVVLDVGANPTNAAPTAPTTSGGLGGTDAHVQSPPPAITVHSTAL